MNFGVQARFLRVSGGRMVVVWPGLSPAVPEVTRPRPPQDLFALVPVAGLALDPVLAPLATLLADAALSPRAGGSPPVAVRRRWANRSGPATVAALNDRGWRWPAR